MGADADLDADDNIAIGVRDLDRIERRKQTDFFTLSDHHALRKGIDAREGHVQIGKDTHRTALDHMLAETRKVTGASASGVNRRGDPRFTAELFRVDTERRAAPIDMGVKVDKPWRDDVTGQIPYSSADIGLQSQPDPRHLASRKAYIDHLVELLRGVDDASSAENKVICHSCGPTFKKIAGSSPTLERSSTQVQGGR